MNGLQQQKHNSQAAVPTALHEKAEDNLRYIRQTMERATSFTGVSGKGCVLAGSTSVFAAWLAAQQSSEMAWLVIWMGELGVAAIAAFGLTVLKAKAQGGSLWSSSGKKLLFAFLPAMIAGGVLTAAFVLQGNISWLPGMWLTIYGAAVMTGGAHSVGALPLMGVLFLVLGALVLLVGAPADLMLGLGMGGLHIIFGLIIWRNHGG